MASDTEQTGIHHGTFFGWFETGLEGMVWALKSKDDNSMKGLVILEKSDWVEIRDKNGVIVFSGEINPDYDVGRTPPDSPLGRNQPTAMGCWIHWTQAEFAPDEWAKFFILGGEYTGYVQKHDGS